jgi:hypothetical protein
LEAALDGGTLDFVPAFLVSFRGSISESDVGALNAEGIVYIPDRSDDGVPSFRVEAGEWQEAGQRPAAALDRRLIDYESLAVTDY